MTAMDTGQLDWRTRKKATTRSTIQRHALGLFAEHGYDAVTVEQIAAAAGVSHMTFFRYFPTKEDVVLSDDHDPLLRTLIRDTPAELPTFERIRRALSAGLNEIYPANRAAMLTQNKIIAATPALRARLWEDQAATAKLILDALGVADGDLRTQLRVNVVAAACLAAASTAILTWAENDGTPELPELLELAFDALTIDLNQSRTATDPPCSGHVSGVTGQGR